MFSLFRVMSRRRGRSSTTADLRQSSRGITIALVARTATNSNNRGGVQPQSCNVCRNRHKTPVGVSAAVSGLHKIFGSPLTSLNFSARTGSTVRNGAPELR